MYTLTVRRHAFIAHSLKRELFGPAAKLHGVTLIVDAEFQAPEIDGNNTVIDVVRASKILKDVLSKYHYKNLDEDPALAAVPTTMEFLARQIHDGISARTASRFQGHLKVTVRESPETWASYAGEVVRARGPRARRA
ncbi:MAG TPA: 6-carboxytetrahydropterin synthase [Candidatus Bathyarchaeia archaeon]|nr:6-carboxytetrahydropterin synthase [Candidatus Bathyarchaeia archaeon]